MFNLVNNVAHSKKEQFIKPFFTRIICLVLCWYDTKRKHVLFIDLTTHKSEHALMSYNCTNIIPFCYKRPTLKLILHTKYNIYNYVCKQ